MALMGYWRGLSTGPMIYIQPASGQKKDPSHQHLGCLPGWNEEVHDQHEVKETEPVAKIFQHLWNDESGQDIAEYAVMLAVILVIVVGTIRLIGSNANNVFSNVGSSIQ
jgi:Flp pilus assembly pilin Flp